MNDDFATIKVIAAGGRQAEQAIAALFMAHRIRLLRYFAKQGVRPEEAEDLVQEVFVRVVRAAHTFREESLVSTWLHRIAKNLLVDSARRTHREQTFDDAGWEQIGNSPAAMVPDNSGASIDQRRYEECQQRQYAEFVRQYPHMADALEKVADLGWPIRDLATHIGRSNDATRQFLVRCRDRLREMLAPCAELFMAVARD